jgi:homoserine dehydrogenase
LRKDVVKVGLIGLGTVGSGVVKIIQKNGDLLERKVGTKLEVAKVLVRDVNKPRSVKLPQGVITTNIKDIIDNPEIDIVVELMGGLSPAGEYVLEAMQNGKSVVTANKDLVAQAGKELFERAEQANVDLLFEASVGGGIPIIRPLKQCLAANRIQQVMGIINGTTNYMLTKMTQEGCEFAAVLAEAQAKGYAEANPAADVEGYDAARKLAILASIAFNTRVTFSDVHVEGITKITAHDIQYAKELDYIIKLLGIAKEDKDGIEVRVHPTLVPKDHPIASVNDVFNAIFVSGDAVGDTMFFGRGAGELPTASAVVADIMEAALNIIKDDRGRITCTCFEHKAIKPMDMVESKFYIRLIVADQPGVLAAIASAFGDQHVSLQSVIQKENLGEQAEVVLVSHRTKEGNIRKALKTLEVMDSVVEISNAIRVEGTGK